MTGGGAMLYGLDKLLQEKTKIKVYLADDPVSCVALGTGMALDDIEVYASIATI
jgi:rod shape-determining protein MreB